MRMRGGWIILFHVITFTLYSEVLAVTVDYLSTSCNVNSVYVSTSRHLESSTALSYSNNVDCYYSVYVDAGKQVYLLVNNFEVEYQTNGACVDYVNLYDGSTASGTTLNASPLCGDAIGTNYTSTSTTLTVHFVTDGSGVRRGFDFDIVAASTGTCDSSQFSCTAGKCIDSSLKCNNFDECGDNSDEANCASNSPPGLSVHDQAALIAGLTIGLSIAAVIAVVVAVFCWRYNRWRVFMKRPLTAQEVMHSETTFTTSYPVTKFYYKEHFQNVYREPQKPKSYGYQGEPVFNAEQGMQNTTI